MKIVSSFFFALFILNFNLSAASYADGSWDYKLPDEIGNLFKTKERKDRQYGRAGQLLKDEKYTYTYDEVGNLIKKESLTETWRYKWTQGGMLSTVIRPDRKHVDFTYDALGRRLTKTFQDQTTHFVWDGNVPLHEWTSSIEESNSTINEQGETEHIAPENLTIWIFEDGTFIPMAKLQGEHSYSIITDHLGTPVESYDEEGTKVWTRELNIYGETRSEFGVKNFIPFLYQGQYLDVETDLAYNRYRYYSPESGTYVSQDPIGLVGAMPNMYSYVKNSNAWVDPFGLFENITLTDGYVYRGVQSGGSHNYSPTTNDLAGATGDHPMEGISTKPPKSHGDLSTGDRNFLEKGDKTVKKIDVAQLTAGGNLSVVKDGKAHASIKPSQAYLDRKGMTMAEALEDWHKGGDSHELSREIQNAASCH